MYYIKYNNIDLTDIVKVRSVEIPSLPSMEHSYINMFERDGNVYNGMSYNNRDIKLQLLIHPEDPDDYDAYVNDVKRAFYTKQEAKLYCGNEDLYMWCVPVNEVIITELGSYCAEAEISLIAYDPYWYSDIGIMEVHDGKKFTVDNECDLPVYPLISVGFSGKDSDTDSDKHVTFIQIENQRNGEKILIGSLPSVSGEVIPKNTEILEDKMEVVTGWSSTTVSNRDCGANLSVNDAENGLCCRNFGSAGDYKWHGACYQKQLNQEITDFKVRVRMKHNSTGKNDPTYPYEDNPNTTTGKTGSKTYYYYVKPSVGLRLRKGPSTKYAKICTMPKGTKLKKLDKKNGWLKTEYKGKTGWCDASYLSYKVVDTTDDTTNKARNYVTNTSLAIRASASTKATNKCTIPTGKVIRCYYDKTYEYKTKEHTYKFYKLAKSYEDSKTGKKYSGYVLYKKDDKDPYLVHASDYKVEYDDDVDIADDKTGICEVYGFSEDGTELFCMGMYDDNEYYEFTYPLISKNGEDFVKDKTVAPDADTQVDYSDSGKKVEKVLSGRYGDWNEFFGELYIERVNNVWKAYVHKIKDDKVIKKTATKTATDKTNSKKDLKYIKIYMGTSGDTDKACTMSITHIEVKTATKIDNREYYTPQPFSSGDVLDIYTDIPAVYLNNEERNDLIDVGSSFFALEPGNNTIKVATDDKSPNFDISYTPKYL